MPELALDDFKGPSGLMRFVANQGLAVAIAVAGVAFMGSVVYVMLDRMIALDNMILSNQQLVIKGINDHAVTSESIGRDQLRLSLGICVNAALNPTTSLSAEALNGRVKRCFDLDDTMKTNLMGR